MAFCSPWVTSLYCSLVVGSVKVRCYCKILYLIKKNLLYESSLIAQYLKSEMICFGLRGF